MINPIINPIAMLVFNINHYQPLLTVNLLNYQRVSLKSPPAQHILQASETSTSSSLQALEVPTEVSSW